MTLPGPNLFPGYDLFPSDSSPALPTVGTVWSFADWIGYEGMPPVPDDLGCLHFVASPDGSSPAVDGWDGAAAPNVQSDQRPTADGTNDGPSTQPGKTVTINGRVRAPDIPTLQQAMGRLSGLLVQGSRYDTLTAREAWATRQLRVRRGADTIVTPQRSVLPEATYSFVLYGPDGVRLGEPHILSTGLPVSSGGITVPLTVPLLMAEQAISGACSATNEGSTEGPVVIRIDGPVVGPVVTHVGSGLQLVFATDLMVPAGEFLLVDMDRHEVLANGQASRNQGVLPNGRGWSRFDVGDNTWTFTAQSGGAGALLTVMATPAWP